MKKKIFAYILVVIPLIVLFLLMWTKEYYGNTKLDEIIFVLLTPAAGTSVELVLDAAMYTLIPVMLYTIIFLILHELSKKHEFINKIFTLLIIGGLLLMCYTVFYINDAFKVKDYIDKRVTSNDFIENNYTKVEYDNIVFPKDKNNLIVIYLESMESTFADKSSGGVYDKNYITKLTKLAKENLSFSNKEEGFIGGAYTAPGLSWTMSGLVATTAGVPIKTQFENANEHKFLYPNIITLGDIMSKNGYNLSFMLGSDATFSGIEDYLYAHGNYKIYDLDYFKDNKLVKKSDLVEWGLKDRDLFEHAKTELTSLSKEDKPFYFSLMTIDTHAPKGVTYKDCKSVSNKKYINTIACADTTIMNFIDWLSEQDFYKNTTIVLTGDHISMSKVVDYKDSERNIYNVFINAKTSPSKQYNRLFTNIDMFPTILGSLGVKIEYDTLGLGTNLFSDKETLVESYGYFDYYNKISYYSEFYDKEILK